MCLKSESGIAEQLASCCLLSHCSYRMCCVTQSTYVIFCKILERSCCAVGEWPWQGCSHVLVSSGVRVGFRTFAAALQASIQRSVAHLSSTGKGWTVFRSLSVCDARLTIGVVSERVSRVGISQLLRQLIRTAESKSLGRFVSVLMAHFCFGAEGGMAGLPMEDMTHV